MTTLLQLEARYQDFSRRGTGGRQALAGFGYQLELSLDRFFETAVTLGPGPAAFAFDSLTDLVEAREELLFFYQAKRTLTRATLRDAWMDFLHLDRFLESERPDLRERARYSIVCAVGDSRLCDYQHATELGLTGADEARWERLRKQYLGWTQYNDPRASLVARLWRRVRQPYAFAERCQGLLLRMLGANAPSRDISEALLREYEREQDGELLAGRPLSPHDFQPDVSDGEQRVLTGQRPHLVDLNAGCFMPRPELLGRVLEMLDDVHRKRLELRTSGRLPIVWIGGGSGAGKSALLLQVLRAWVLRYAVPAIYLEHFARELPLTIRRLGASGGMIAIDDLYAPDARRADLWSEISRLASAVTSVTLLACGPSDYFEAFRELCQREGTFELLHIAIPPLSDAEGAGYLDWYRCRTGCDATTLPSRNFVSAAFALERRRRGDATLEEFAARLKQRLQEMAFLVEFRAALALNRLGFQVPRSFFDGHGDSLERLQSEALLMGDTDSPDRRALWFHPQVAGALYRIWRPPSISREARIDDIRRCFRALQVDSSEAGALLQFLRKRTGDLDDTFRRDVAAAIWKDLVAEEPQQSSVHLMRQCRALALSLGLDVVRTVPLEIPLRWLGSHELDRASWAMVAVMFWNRLDEQARAALALDGCALLGRQETPSEWRHLWQCLWDDPVADRSKLTMIAVSWIQAQPAAPGWTYIFQVLLDGGYCSSAALLEAGRAWLRCGRPSGADFVVWGKLRRLGLGAEEAVALLVVCGAKHWNPYVVRKILSQLRMECLGLPAAVLLGLEMAQDGEAWSFVFEGLCKRHLWLVERDLSRLRAIGRQWLMRYQQKPGWGFVWNALLSLQTGDVALIDMGLEWLKGHEDDATWSRVWHRIHQVDSGDSRTRRSGLSWLTRNTDKPGWGIVWQRLFRAQAADQELRQLGLAWLSGHEDEPTWAFVWELLFDSSPADPDLRARGFSWLESRRHRIEAPYVLRRLLPASSTRFQASRPVTRGHITGRFRSKTDHGRPAGSGAGWSAFKRRRQRRREYPSSAYNDDDSDSP